MSFHRQRRVYVGDDDASGLIFFPMYFHYMNEGEQDFFARLDLPVAAQIRNRHAMPVVHAECDYVSAAIAGDVLDHSMYATTGARSSVTFRHEFRRSADLVARALIVRAYTDLDSLQSVELIADIKRMIERSNEPAI
jgi:YbgC/YbaW family acyl-CoA thioester hydrolase